MATCPPSNITTIPNTILHPIGSLLSWVPHTHTPPSYLHERFLHTLFSLEPCFKFMWTSQVDLPFEAYGQTPHETKGFLEKIISSICYINLNFRKEPKVFMGECGSILNYEFLKFIFWFSNFKKIGEKSKRRKGATHSHFPHKSRKLAHNYTQ